MFPVHADEHAIMGKLQIRREDCFTPVRGEIGTEQNHADSIGQRKGPHSMEGILGILSW